MIPKEIIDEIFETSRIEEVVGEFVQLRRAGSNLKGLSPFTEEKTPSFIVSPAKQIFKCFSSGKGGNVVSFLMEAEAMSYPEALRWLANKYGIEIPEREETPEELAKRNEKESLFIINEFAQKTFEENLWEDRDGRAIGLSYFRERGYTDDTIKKFHLGYCLEANTFWKTADKAGYNLEHLNTLGLIKKNDKGYFDFYRGRVMFPIHNLTGRVVGFGGRTLKADKKIAKYFNSPENPIYNKSKVLYGLYQAKSEIVKQDNCFLVEGYTDVISLAQAGVENVVSSSGTALTKGQIQLIYRYTKNVTILYDGDAAGIRASFRGIDMILEHGLNVRVVLFPEGEDPDSFAKSSTKEELTAYLSENAKDFISFKAEVLAEEAGKDPVKRAELIKDIVHSISLIPDQITRSVMIKTCAERFEMEEEALLQELARSRNEHQQEQRPSRSENKPVQATETKPATTIRVEDSEVAHQERDITRLLINYGREEVVLEWDEGEEGEQVAVATYIVDELVRDGLELRTPGYADIFEIFVQHHQEGKVPRVETFYTHHNPDIARLAVDLSSSQYSLSENWWNMHNIETREEKDKLLESIQSGLHSYKMKALDDMINKSQQSLKDLVEEKDLLDALEYQAGLIETRKRLAEIMGRVILK